MPSAEKAWKAMPGEVVLWREGVTRPSQMRVARARLKDMMASSRQPRASLSSTAMRATSLLNSVTYMERSAANGRPTMAASKATSSWWRLRSTLANVTVAVPPTNDVDLFANDFGLIAVVDADGGLAGFNVAIGGGMGASHGDPKTYPRLGNVIGFVAPDQVLAIAAAAITVQRDHGDRVERKHARFKYTIDEHGLDYIVAQMEERAGFKLQPARPFHFDHNGDRFGWVEGEDGRWHLTLSLPTGRIADRPGAPHLTGMREIANVHRGEFRVTANQNLVIAGVPAGERERIDALVRAHALDQENRAPTALARASMACVALPTCALAMAEAERYLPDFNAKLQPMLEKHGLADAPILLRISGCPNGCSRPYLGEIALVGKAPGRYNLMLGADHRGQRLNRLHKENIAETEILETVDALFGRYAAEREAEERFGDFLVRSGIVAAKPGIALEVRT